MTNTKRKATKRKAEELGCSPELAVYILMLEDKIEELEEKLRKMDVDMEQMNERLYDVSVGYM